MMMKKINLMFTLLAIAAFSFLACNQNESTKDTLPNKVNISPVKGETPVAQTVANTAGYDIGDTASDFKLKNVNGKIVSMADYPDAKGFIIVFTCNACPYAKMYEDRIIALHNKFASKGYPVIAINPNDPEIVEEDSYENMQVRAKEKGFPYPYIFDEKQEVLAKYGATKTPHVFLLNNNKVVEYIGAIDDNPRDASAVKDKYVENAIAALNSGTKPDPATTRAIGCSVKVKK